MQQKARVRELNAFEVSFEQLGNLLALVCTLGEARRRMRPLAQPQPHDAPSGGKHECTKCKSRVPPSRLLERGRPRHLGHLEHPGPNGASERALRRSAEQPDSGMRTTHVRPPEVDLTRRLLLVVNGGYPHRGTAPWLDIE